MTVQTETSRSGPYAGSGTTGPFTVGFRFLDNTHLQVIRTSSAGVDTTLVITTDYSVSGAGGSSGTVTLVSALASGETLTVIRGVPFTQLADYVDNDAFPAESHENALDLLTMQTQQNREVLDRSLTLPATTSGVSTELPVPEANKLIGWNETADALQNIDSGTLATIVAYGTASGDIFSGTGAQTVFTLGANPGALYNLDVSIGGVDQRPTLDYTWSDGTDLTFVTAPVAGTNNISVKYKQALPQGTADSAAVTYLPAGAGAVATTVQGKLRESVSVFDFMTAAQITAVKTNNYSGAVTSVHAGIQAAVDAIKAADSNAISLFFPDGHYFFTSPVYVYTDDFEGIKFFGDSTVSNYNQRGAVITGSAALLSLFVFRHTNLATNSFFSFECKNISFISSGKGTTGPQTALLSLDGGQASRPFVVENCYFKGFLAAIKSDLTASGKATGLCNATITKNMFINNTYAVHGVGNDAFVNLNFSDNAAGTGGSVHTTMGGTYLISGNIFESNSIANGYVGPIDISGGLHNGTIVNNYFEDVPSTALISVSATAPQSSVYIDQSFVTSSTDGWILLSNVNFVCPQDLTWAGIKTKVSQSSGKCILNSQGKLYRINQATGATCEAVLDVSSISLDSTVLPSAGNVSNAVWTTSATGSYENTPLVGKAARVLPVTNTGTANRTVTATIAAGDCITFQGLFRRKTGNGAWWFDVINGAETLSMGSTNTNSFTILTAVGEWVYFVKHLQVTNASGGTFKFLARTVDAGTTIDLTDIYVYTQTGVSDATPIYLGLPPLLASTYPAIRSGDNTPSLMGAFTSLDGSTNSPTSGAPVTLFTLPSGIGTYIVSMGFNGVNNPTTYSAVSIICSDGTAAVRTNIHTSAGMSITNTGLAISGTQTFGNGVNITWTCIRIL